MAGIGGQVSGESGDGEFAFDFHKGALSSVGSFFRLLVYRILGKMSIFSSIPKRFTLEELGKYFRKRFGKELAGKKIWKAVMIRGIIA